MYIYKFYELDKKEHFEIWQENILIKSIEAPFGKALFDYLVLDKISIINSSSDVKFSVRFSVIKFNSITKYLSPSLLIEKLDLFLFFNHQIELYREKDNSIPPEENTWLKYDFKHDDLYGTEEQLHSDIFYDGFNATSSFFNKLCSDKNIELSIDPPIQRTLDLGLEKYEGEIVEVLYPHHMNDIFYYYIIHTARLLKTSKLVIKKCQRCDRMFAVFKYSDRTIFCDYVDEWGYSCKDHNDRYFLGKDATFEYKKAYDIYQRYYSYQHNRLKQKLITKEQEALWRKMAKIVLKQCKNQELDVRTFSQWLEANKNKYDWTDDDFNAQ
ncbi:MAG: hypothetical protein UIM53_04220 [Acutalibacteraceae bacterium]|nr:hypothetical protein [Acutalibacteraceae bacterium]